MTEKSTDDEKDDCNDCNDGHFDNNDEKNDHKTYKYYDCSAKMYQFQGLFLVEKEATQEKQKCALLCIFEFAG